MAPYKEPTVFSKVEQITGQAFPREMQTPAMETVLQALFDRAIDTDSKTGAANERVFNRRLDEALRRMHRYNQSLQRGQKQDKPEISVIAIDLDGFKQINDTLGHQAGDAALKHVVDFFNGRLRPGDSISRTGGDEFSIIMQTTADNAEKTMQRLRDELVEKGFSYEGNPAYLSYSFGVHQLSERDNDRAAVIRIADDRQREDKSGKMARFDTYRVQKQRQGSAGQAHAERVENSRPNDSTPPRP